MKAILFLGEQAISNQTQQNQVKSFTITTKIV